MTFVFCTLRFPAFHCWADAPDKYRYLRAPHRHEFHVRVDVRVAHDDRDIEFIELKREAFVALTALGSFNPQLHGHYDFGGRSCEQIATYLHDALDTLNVAAIEVSEDGENGARVTW